MLCVVLLSFFVSVGDDMIGFDSFNKMVFEYTRIRVCMSGVDVRAARVGVVCCVPLY